MAFVSRRGKYIKVFAETEHVRIKFFSESSSFCTQPVILTREPHFTSVTDRLLS